MFGLGRFFHFAFEIRAGQVIKQQVVSGPEEILPAPLQMREQIGAVPVNPVQTFIEPVFGRHREIFLQQLIHRAGKKPLAVQMPFAARSDQLAHRQ